MSMSIVVIVYVSLDFLDSMMLHIRICIQRRYFFFKHLEHADVFRISEHLPVLYRLDTCNYLIEELRSRG